MIRAESRSRTSRTVTHALVVSAWVALLLLSLRTVRVGGLGVSSSWLEHVTLCVVTTVGAASCLWRALTRDRDRLGWSLVGAGLAGYAGGFCLIFLLHTGRGPLGLNLSDWVSLPMYPLIFAGLVVLRGDRRSPDPTTPGRPAQRGDRTGVAAALDGLVAALAAGAVLVTLVGGRNASLFHGQTSKVIYALAYPVGSLTLFAGALMIIAVRQWQISVRWLLLLAGFGALAVGDVIYSLRQAQGAFAFGTWLDAVYAAGPALVGIGAWFDVREQPINPNPSAVILAIPGVATLLALAVLLADHVQRVTGLAVILAGAGIALSVGRTALYVRAEHRYERARRDALTDELTGLANRRALDRLLAPRLGSGEVTTLLLVDLDGFKEINDTLGHAAGDELLIGVASRLAAIGSAVQVARIGGDEFAVVVDGSVSADAYGVQVCRAIEQPLLIDGAIVAVGASVGHAASGRGAEAALTSGELLRRADVAMYRAKELRTDVEGWVADLDVGTRERLETMAALRAALADPTQLVVHYQPQYDSHTLRLVGLEALARWDHPVRGLLGPGEFLPAAEQAGLLCALTERVLDESLRQIRRFADAGHRVPVSVNVTAPDLVDLRFAERVTAALHRHGVPAELLRVEITETVVMTDPLRVLQALEQLCALGIRLSLDDYGTGLSSLSYLQTLPVDELKIDRSFVSRITCDPASAMIVASTIDLAHALQLVVVAEGVEDQATLDLLSAANCDAIQGFLLGRPGPAASLRLTPLDDADVAAPSPQRAYPDLTPA